MAGGLGSRTTTPTEKQPCLYPLPDGRRCLECATCQPTPEEIESRPEGRPSVDDRWTPLHLWIPWNDRWHRFYNNARCFVGLHRLRGYEGCGDGVNVLPIDPRGKPGPKAWRVCDWCGATWHGAYDGIGPFWKRSGGNTP